MLQAAEAEARLVELAGGTGPSAIPTEASCVVLVPAGRAAAFCEGLQTAFAEVRAEFGAALEPGLEFSAAPCPACAAPEDVAALPPPPPRCQRGRPHRHRHL